MYVSALFKKSLAYANQIQPVKKNIYILSAKHGLLPLDQEIEPYEFSLKFLSNVKVKKWAKNVLNQLEEVCTLDETDFILFAGERYRRYLVPHLKSYEIPLKGLGIGKQLKELNELVK